jgi:hypothetical protein
MKRLARWWTMAMACLAMNAFATPQAVNLTGLWLRGDESGWGLYLSHQGDTVFATLFVYGQDGQPRWYSASELRCDDGAPAQGRAKSCSGALFESTGTPWYEPFSAPSVTRRQVGNMALELAGSVGTLTYTIDDVRVTKTVQPFTWRMNDLTTSYRATLVTAGGVAEQVDLEMRMDTSAGTYNMTTRNAFGMSCTYSGPATEVNMSVYLAGSYSCTDGSSGAVGFSIDPSPNGFAAAGPRPNMRMAAVRTGPENYIGNGWMNDLWFVNGQSGWGLNLVGQGDTLFGTLFVYDATRRAKWYSAPALKLVGGLNDRYWPGRYEGPLFESTGPWYGAASFNPNQVTRRQVGIMVVEFGSGVALTYIIDGAPVGPKYLIPFAMRANSMTGSYVGRYYYPPNGIAEDLRISITDGATWSMRTTSATGTTCDYPTSSPNGRFQSGHRVGVVGLYTCSDGKRGSFSLLNGEVSYDGFTAQFNVDGRIVGNLAAARTSF